MKNKLIPEVKKVLTYGLFVLGSLLCTLQLSTGSFPKPLTEEEEKQYLALAAQGSLEARNILIERNLRLVAHIMKKYYTQTSDQEDLISIGTIGLIKGITTFDQSKGARLATYAARCVENAILSQTRLYTEDRAAGVGGGEGGVHPSKMEAAGNSRPGCRSRTRNKTKYSGKQTTESWFLRLLFQR